MPEFYAVQYLNYFLEFTSHMFLNDNTDYSVDISLINLYHLLFICNTLSYYLLFIFITNYHSNLLEDRT